MTDDKTSAHCGEPLDADNRRNITLSSSEALRGNLERIYHCTASICAGCWDRLRGWMGVDDE